MTARSSHVTGERREIISEQLENKSVSNFHYSLFTEPDNIVAVKHGNVSYLHSTDIFRKGNKSQHVAKSRFDNDKYMARHT